MLSRIQPVGQLAFADATPSGNKTGEQVFQAVCKTCHESGLAGAPKFGDKAAWAAPIKSGYDVLLQHAINGLQRQGKVMPPKGGNPDLTDTEVARAVVYMANAAGAALQGARGAGRDRRSAAASAVAHRHAPQRRLPPPQLPPAAARSQLPQLATAPLDMKTAEAMMQKDGCAACHGVDKKIVGPAYQEVAAKYRGDKDALAKLTQKVKAGGSGVWGAVPMPPNAQVPEADIKALVTWILTLKK